MKIAPALIEQLRAAKHVAVLTGAGVSAESGVPTFRDAQTGLWANYRAEDLATPRAFKRNPRLVWDWYEWRRKLVRQAAPNPAHVALVELERSVPDFTLITQNVDGLHQRAGSTRCIELHGNVMRTKCFDEGVIVDKWPETADVPPKCPRCGGLLRPDVVWFEEALPALALADAETAAQSCDVFLSIGTSGVVYPAAALPFTAGECGAIVAEVNSDETALTGRADHVLRGAAGIVLPELVRALKAKEA